MSTALAIGATTRVLMSVLQERLSLPDAIDVVVAAQTTSLPPDRVVTGVGELTHLNVFLYQIFYHHAGGRQIGRPPLALELHYLLSAYGEDSLEAQILLGLGMQAFNETPILDPATIARALAPPLPTSALDRKLATANLQGQVEAIKIAPEALATDELAKLWSAFGSKYRPSIAYAVSLVLIDDSAGA